MKKLKLARFVRRNGLIWTAFPPPSISDVGCYVLVSEDPACVGAWPYTYDGEELVYHHFHQTDRDVLEKRLREERTENDLIRKLLEHQLRGQRFCILRKKTEKQQ